MQFPPRSTLTPVLSHHFAAADWSPVTVTGLGPADGFPSASLLRLGKIHRRTMSFRACRTTAICPAAEIVHSHAYDAGRRFCETTVIVVTCTPVEHSPEVRQSLNRLIRDPKADLCHVPVTALRQLATSTAGRPSSTPKIHHYHYCGWGLLAINFPNPPLSRFSLSSLWVLHTYTKGS